MKDRRRNPAIIASGSCRLAAIAAALLASVSPTVVLAESASDDAQAVSQADKARWFEEAKFGLFIHWGISSEAAGIWEGERYYGITEWLMRRGEITTEDYATLTERFNPVDFDAREWVAFAKQAGFKYIVVTAKHHDGFAMYDSKVSDFDIVDATPYKKDPLAELAREAAKEGIKLGFYYSQYQDWSEPNAAGNEWEFPIEGRVFEEYQQRKAQPQLAELLTNYGDVGIIWFDTPGEITEDQARNFADWVRNLQPNTLISDRIGHGLGDYKGYGDAEVPDIPEEGKPWEAIYTHNDSWGYSDFDTNFKSTTEIIHILADVAGKGGNLMLNIGPDGRGRMPEGSTKRILGVGEWLETYGEAIYGTTGSPLGPVPWGTATKRPGKLYLHVTHAPDDGELVVPNVPETIGVEGVTLMANGAPVAFRRNGSDLLITLPDELPSAANSVLTVAHSGAFAPYKPPYVFLVDSNYPETKLIPAMAELTGGAKDNKLRFFHYFGDWKTFQTIEGLAKSGDTAKWHLRVMEPGDYKVTLVYNATKAQAGGEGFVDLAGTSVAFQVLQTDSREGPISSDIPTLFIEHDVGVVSIEQTGQLDLVLRPREDGEDLFILREIILEPVD